jgi:hypothetical protein
MNISVRSFALVAVLALIAVPSVKAERTGCNPHPQVVIAVPTVLQIITDTVVSYLGL